MFEISSEVKAAASRGDTSGPFQMQDGKPSVRWDSMMVRNEGEGSVVEFLWKEAPVAWMRVSYRIEGGLQLTISGLSGSIPLYVTGTGL